MSVEIEDAEIKTRHKGRRQKIREDHADVGIIGGSSNTENPGPGINSDGLANGTSQGVGGAGQESGNETRSIAGSAGPGAQGTESGQGVANGLDSGIRPTNGTPVNTAKSNDRVVSTTESQQHSDAINEFDSEAEKERKRELHRQRQARYEARQKEANGNTSASGQERQREKLTQADSPQIQLKNFAQKPDSEIKLLTKDEVHDNRDKLVYLYMKASEIIDDILEIIVRDHEPIQIWALDEDEAGMLADMQLEQSRKDKGAARTVRIMLRIYERLFWFVLVGPRVKATYSHVKEHRGFSFK